jgi:putative heme-binding domain-containing protein
MFHSTACYACHRFDGRGGGLGPDLTTAASRFSLRDLVENIVEPSQVISDQYGSESVELADGTMLIGRAYEEDGRLHVVYDPRNPDEREAVELARVKARRPYPVSFMPTGLLNGLNPEEVLDLLGYVLSGGDREHALIAESGDFTTALLGKSVILATLFPLVLVLVLRPSSSAGKRFEDEHEEEGGGGRFGSGCNGSLNGAC